MEKSSLLKLRHLPSVGLIVIIDPTIDIFNILLFSKRLTPWLMEPGGSMQHSQGLSNNSYPEPNQPNSPH